MSEDVPQQAARGWLINRAAIRKISWQLTALQSGARTSPLAGLTEGKKLGLLGSASLYYIGRWTTAQVLLFVVLSTLHSKSEKSLGTVSLSRPNQRWDTISRGQVQSTGRATSWGTKPGRSVHGSYGVIHCRHRRKTYGSIGTLRYARKISCLGLKANPAYPCCLRCFKAPLY